ncbi:hypothetical protein B7486_03545 [cyanobacterium TDX16]|nr:hypothetical protein B7486_03545 [cyanobacterium TDX16]
MRAESAGSLQARLKPAERQTKKERVGMGLIPPAQTGGKRWSAEADPMKNDMEGLARIHFLGSRGRRPRSAAKWGETRSGGNSSTAMDAAGGWAGYDSPV